MLRREMGTTVDMVHGRYGEFKILVDRKVVVEAGLLSVLWIVPSDRAILDAVRRAASPAPAA